MGMRNSNAIGARGHAGNSQPFHCRKDSVFGYTLVPDRPADFNQWTGVRLGSHLAGGYVCYLPSPSATVSVLGTIDGEGRSEHSTVRQKVFL
jgi:hypothetical protein